MTTPDDIRSKLSSKFQDKLIKASEVEDERMPLASIGLTRALDGGVRYGSISVFGGNTGSGKSAMLLQSMGQEMVNKGKTAAVVDVEGAFDPKWAAELGVPVDDLMWSSVKDIGNVADLSVELIEAKTDILLIDSISLLATSNIADEDGEVRGFGDNKQMARLAVELGKLVNMVNFANSNTAILLISQIRNNITTQGAFGFTLAGGKAMEHAANTIVTLTSSQAENKFINSEVSNGRVMIEKPIGRNVSWTIKKHRGPGIASTGKYDFYFDGDTIGVDVVGEVVDLATVIGEIVKGGSWFTLPNGERFQGRHRVVEYYKDHPDEFEILTKEVLS